MNTGTLVADSRLRLHGAIALFSVPWLDFLRQLSFSWSQREHYAYGWFVPFFSIYLIWMRWLDRPEQRPVKPSWWSIPAVCLLAGVLLPLRVIFEINADWPLIAWIYGVLLVCLSLHIVSIVGGMSWVRHFSFPILFILVAIIWPDRIEKGLTQGLMRTVASLAVEVLAMVDVAALQRGNLIEVGTGVVGVDEACSGIRSLQSSLMAGLLIGELFRLTVRGRVALVVSGLGIAFVFNVLRTVVLSYQASLHGVDEVARWHDGAGLSTLVVCLGVLWGIALLMKRHGSRQGGEMPTGSVVTPGLMPRHEDSLGARRTAIGYMSAIGCWAILCLAGSELWYRIRDRGDHQGFHWTVQYPTASEGYSKIELTERVRGLIRSDEGGAAAWLGEGGVKWTMFFFRWEPRPIQSVLMSRAHRPEVCLPATGFMQIGDSQPVSIDLGWLSIPFRGYTYQTAGEVVHVFFCQWEDGDSDQSGMSASKERDRLQSVLSGRRRVGQQTLEFILAGCSSYPEAEQALRQALPRILLPEPGVPARPVRGPA